MAEIQILSETPLTLVEIKERLEKIKKRDTELSQVGEKTKEYLDRFTIIKLKEVEELRKKLNELNIPRLKDRHIAKIIDIYPKDMDSLKTLFVGENITIKPEELKRILECLK